MTTLALEAPETVLAVAAPAPTQLVAALDPPLVMQVAPSRADLTVTVARAGTLTAPAAQGPTGPAGPRGLPGPPGTTSIIVIPSAETIWTLAHNLGRYPSVTLVDTAGDLVAADVTYLDADTIVVAFGAATAGTAYLN